MKKGLVINWMTSPVVTVTPETHLSDARRIMDAERIRALPVVKDEALVGIVTRRGLLRVDLSPLDSDTWRKNVDLNSEKIGSIMTTNVITTIPSAQIAKVARVMMENKIAALPVIGDQRKLVGVITSSDMFRVLIDELPDLKGDVRVKDYMSAEVVTIEPDTSILEAHRLMGVKRIRSLPVLNGEQLVGVVTRTDLMSADPSKFASKNNQELSRQIESMTIDTVMSKELVVISESAPVIEAAKLMLTHKIHCLPVIGDNGQLAGIITESDLFRLIVQKFF